jgi:hypothetical protein
MLYVNQNKLEHMIKLITHKDVVDTIVKTANPRLFNVYRNDELGYTAIVPKVDGIRPSLCVHTDTVNNIHPTEIEKNNDVWRNADHTKLLGADDRAGCYIIKELITRGMDDYNYLIFDQEEVGGIGSSNYAKTNDGKVVDILTSCYIGLDRLGCMQQALYGYESDEFLDAIEEDYWVNDLGSFTDASNLAGDFNKCCMNLSVGYDSEHTRYETLNVSHMAVTLNRLYNGLNDALWGTYFIPDEQTNGYGLTDDEWDDYYTEKGGFYDEYVFCNEINTYIPYGEKWKYDEFNSAFTGPVIANNDENGLPNPADYLIKGV